MIARGMTDPVSREFTDWASQFHPCEAYRPIASLIAGGTAILNGDQTFALGIGGTAIYGGGGSASNFVAYDPKTNNYEIGTSAGAGGGIELGANLIFGFDDYRISGGYGEATINTVGMGGASVGFVSATVTAYRDSEGTVWSRSVGLGRGPAKMPAGLGSKFGASAQVVIVGKMSCGQL